MFVIHGGIIVAGCCPLALRAVSFSPMEALPSALVKLAQKLELPMGALGAIRQLRARLEDLEYAAVASAREKGASWEEIATTLGITRQALQQRVQRHAMRPPDPVIRLEQDSPNAV